MSFTQVGHRASYLRFGIVFVGSTDTGEAPAIDALRIPWECVDRSAAEP